MPSTFQSFRANKQQQKVLLAAATERYHNIAGRKEAWEDHGYPNINIWYADLFKAKYELKAAEARYTNACRQLSCFTLASIIINLTNLALVDDRVKARYTNACRKLYGFTLAAIMPTLVD